MTSITLNPKYINILRTFGDVEQNVEAALQEYIRKQLEVRVAQARQEVIVFETKYAMTYEQFCERTATDDTYLAHLEAMSPLWERDLNAWEFYEEDLAEWRGQLKSISSAY